MLSGKQELVIIQLASGLKSKQQIAEEFNITNRTISNWLRNEEFQKEYQKELEIMMSEASAEALKTILSLMKNAESESVRFNCAKDILSRAGFDATSKSKVDLATPENIVITINEDE